MHQRIWPTCLHILPVLVMSLAPVAAVRRTDAIRLSRVAVLPNATGAVFPCGDANHNGRFEIYCNTPWPSESLVIFEYAGANNTFNRIVPGIQTRGGVWAFGDGDGDGLAEILCNPHASVEMFESPDSYSFPVDSVWGFFHYGTGACFHPQYTDLDLDGHEELALSVEGYGIWLFENAGNNRYDSVAVLAYNMPYAYHGQFAVGDFDRDGRPELVSGEGHPNIYVYEWTGVDNQYVLSAVCSTETRENYAFASSRNMDKDSWPEFVTLGRVMGDDPGLIQVFEASGPAQYHRVWEQELPVALLSEEGISTGDIDGDGVDEFAVATSGQVFVYRNAGPDSYEQVCQLDSCGWYVRLFDVNRDGRAEVIFQAGTHVVVYEDTDGLSQVSESKPHPMPLRVEVRPAVVRLGTSVAFSGLPEQSELSVYSAGGQLIRKQATGRSTAWTWDLTDQHGRRVPAGTYFAVIRYGSQTTRTKLCVVN